MTTIHRRTGVDVIDPPATRSERTPAAVMYRIGGREYPMRTVKECDTCMSDFRIEIEDSVLKGYSYARIHRGLPERDDTPSIRSISNHAKHHLPTDLAVRRAVMEDRAREVGQSIEEAEGTLIDHVSFAKVGLQRVVERMASGVLEPDVKDGIAFATLLARLDERASGSGDMDQMALMQGFMVFHVALTKHCSPEQRAAIAAEIQANPIMQTLLGRAQRQDAIDVSATPRED